MTQVPYKKRRKSAKSLAKEQRIEAVEVLMTEHLAEPTIFKAVGEKFGVSSRTVRADMATIRTRWAEESIGVDREQRRAHITKTLQRVISTAFRRLAQIKEPEKGAPLLNSIVRASHILARVDGVDRIEIDMRLHQSFEVTMERWRDVMPPEIYERIVFDWAANTGLTPLALEGAGEDSGEKATERKRGAG